jgi:threonine-phosphate decarboxylase
MSSEFDHGGTVFAVARELGVAPEAIIDFSASINPLGPAPGVREALAAAFDRLGHYPDDSAAELTAALAAWHGLDPAQVGVANGSTELIYLLPRLVAGSRALIVAPPFSEYARALSRAGWQVDYFFLSPADGFALSLPDLAERLATGYDLLILANPGNPTGALVPLAQVTSLLEACRQAGTFLVLDEAFMDFCEEASAKRLVAGSGGALVLRSMTKFFAIPGLRLGYALAAAGIIARLRELREPWSVNSLAQVAGIASLADPAYAARTRAFVAAERDWLAARLAELPGLAVFPSAANYLLVELTDGTSADALAARLRQERLLVRACGNFPGLDSRFFRVAVRARAENERLLGLLAGC